MTISTFEKFFCLFDCFNSDDSLSCANAVPFLTLQTFVQPHFYPTMPVFFFIKSQLLKYSPEIIKK